MSGRYRQFYLRYPQIVDALPPQFASQLGGAAHGLTGGIGGQTLVARLSFTHFVELIGVEDDTNPPAGILLCTPKDHAPVEYALAGIDNGLFVSKYLLALPKKEEMQRFIEEQLSVGAQ
jgi:hypothetical protein